MDLVKRLDLLYFAQVAKRRLAFFLVPFLTFLVVGIGIIMVVPKVYNSSAKILVESQQIPDSFVKATVTAMAAERLEILKQRVLTRENLLNLVDKFSLFQNRKSVSKSEIVDLMRDRINFENLDIGLGAGKKGKGNDRLTVAFAVGFNSESPTMAAKVANELVTIVLEEDARNRTSAASETTKFLSREASRLADELSKMDATLADFKSKNSAMLPEKLQFSMALLERQNREIEDLDRTIANAADQKRLIELEAKIKQGTNDPGGAVVASGSVLEQQLAKLQLAYTQNSAIYSETHPEMRALRTQIKTIQKQIAEASASAQDAKPIDTSNPNLSADMQLAAEKLRTIDQSVEEAKKRQQDLARAAEETKKNIEGTAAVTANLESLLRRRATLQASSDEIESKLSQAKLGEQLEEDQQAERFSVIEAPVVPTEPVSPKRLQLVMLAFAAALGAGGASAFGTEFFDHTIRRGRNITSGSHRTNLLVSVPYIKLESEVKKRNLKAIYMLLLAILALAVGLLIIHLFITPLDLFIYSVRSALKI